MKWIKWVLSGLAVILIAGAAAVYFTTPYWNDYRKDGELAVEGFHAPVTISRDGKNMAYIHAQNTHDAIMAQGFAAAQDRLFQMQLSRLFSQGRISELAGNRARGIDVRMRTIGIHRLAQKQADLLNPETREYFQAYVDGINAFIEKTPEDIPIEFKLAGIPAETWTVADSLSILYYMAWSTSANLNHEVVGQMLLQAVGREKARQILPVNINPDDPANTGVTAAGPAQTTDVIAGSGRAWAKLAADPELFPGTEMAMGSNNWAVGPDLAPGSRPILAGDPHLDPRMLPGVWYPVGLITPEVRAVGANIPGLPGMAIGRTEHISIAMTNNYGDMQDLYVETVDPDDPDHYREGEKSIPFAVIEETIRIKDENAKGGFREETIQIRRTRRGPVISDVIPGLDTDRVISLRWAPAETMQPGIGLLRILTARSASELSKALEAVPMLCLNWVFADSQGNIGYRASGKLPIRKNGGGSFPYVVTDGTDNWQGWIPQEKMPSSANPDRDWLGTCNHKTVPADFPWYYSSYFAPSYRYQQLKSLMARPGKKSVDDHWRFQRNTKNRMAAKIAPVMAAALMAHEDTRQMGQILSGWDFTDDPDLAAPAVFQAVYIEFARRVFVDELGSETAMTMLKNWYFWQERLQRMVLSGNSDWFDDQRTPDQEEDINTLFHAAALEVLSQLSPELGENPANWAWGDVHTLTLVSPIRQEGPGKDLLGTGPMPMPGSGETLCRGWYDYDDPFGVTHCASLRMVVDMADDEKVLAVLPGGVTGRVFSPHQKDQVKAYMDGDRMYWWFSDAAIREHTRHTLFLEP